MEGVQENNGNQRKVIILSSKIIKKLRTKEDRLNFCRENNVLIFIIFFILVYPY